jgi:signal transduction histidine kinase
MHEEEGDDRAERYEKYFHLSSEGIWCFQLSEPIPITVPEDEQIERIFRDSVLVECNETMAAMYGLVDPAGLVGRPLSALLDPTARENIDLLRSFVRSRYRIIEAESHELDGDRRERWFLNNFVGVVVDGCLVQAWATQRDVSAMKRLAEQARRGQKLEAVGRLAGGLAHDFNNLLSVILGAASFAQHQLGPGNVVESELADITGAARRGGELTRRLLAFSRRQPARPTHLEIDTLVTECATLLQRVVGKGIELRVTPGAALGSVLADGGQLEQVIMNLVINSCDAMPSGGSVTVETADVYVDPEAIPEELPPGAWVLLAVRDTGHGMASEVRERLFEPFFTTKEKGTGLGLAMSYGIVKEAGGFILVDSKVGTGTSIRIYLPRLVEAEAADPLTRSPSLP